MKPKPPPFGDKHHRAGTAAFSAAVKETPEPPSWPVRHEKGKNPNHSAMPHSDLLCSSNKLVPQPSGNNQRGFISERGESARSGTRKARAFPPRALRRQLTEGAGERSHPQPHAPESLQPPVPPGCSPRSRTRFRGGTTGQSTHPSCASAHHGSAGSGACGNPTGNSGVGKSLRNPDRGVKHKLRACGMSSVWGLYTTGAVRQRLLLHRLPAGPNQGSPFAAEKATRHPLSFPYSH